MAEADVSVGVAGLSQRVPVTAFRGRAAWTGYDLVSGRWYAGPDQVLVPTEFLATTGTAVGDSVNTASRLEALTKSYGAQLVVSEALAGYRFGCDHELVPGLFSRVRAMPWTHSGRRPQTP